MYEGTFFRNHQGETCKESELSELSTSKYREGIGGNHLPTVFDYVCKFSYYVYVLNFPIGTP